MNTACKTFYENNIGGVKTVPWNKDEIMIVYQNGSEPTFCFKESNPENKKFGWCKTAGNYYEVDNPSKDNTPVEWGYCSRDCYLQEDHRGILRIVDRVEV